MRNFPLPTPQRAMPPTPGDQEIVIRRRFPSPLEKYLAEDCAVSMIVSRIPFHRLHNETIGCAARRTKKGTEPRAVSDRANAALDEIRAVNRPQNIARRFIAFSQLALSEAGPSTIHALHQIRPPPNSNPSTRGLTRTVPERAKRAASA
jgi:hypothetical protein